MGDLFNSEQKLHKLKQASLKELKTLQKLKMLEARAKRDAKLKKRLMPLPDKKYQLIYIDPPWKYDFSRSKRREIENQYPTMDLEEIKALPIGELAEDDSVIFLWATSPKLEEAIQVINAYGFKYVTSAVWDKIKIGMGYYFRSRHEHILVGKKGALPVPDPKNRPDSVIEIPRGKHSKKPTEFYEILENMYPKATKIEIFSRIKREGWDVWGFEAGMSPSSDQRTILRRPWEQE